MTSQLVEQLHAAAALPALSLADVNAAASLQTRRDRKYLVTPEVLLDVVRALPTGGDLGVLQVDGRFEQQYRSVYFDTDDLRCFHDHRRGRRIRDKIRIRHYDDRRVSYLEVKSRRNASHTDKHRRQIDYGQDTIDERGRHFLHKHSVVPAEVLRPELWVDYRRLMLIGRDRDERCTFDVALAVSTPDRARSAPALDKIVFVEVKQPMVDLSSPVMRGLAAIHQRPRSASKYIFAVTSLHPAVRANRLLPDLRSLHRMAR